MIEKIKVDFSPAQRDPLKLWQEFLRVCGCGGDVRSDKPDDFYAKACFCVPDLFSTNAAFIAFGSHHYQKTKSECAKAKDQYFILTRVNTGKVFVEQAGRSVFVGAGQCFCRTTGDPFQTKYENGYTSTSLTLPAQLLRLWLPSPEDIIARPLDEKTPWGQALLASLAGLAENTFEERIVSPQAITDQILCLLALTAGQTLSPASTYRAEIVSRLRKEMQERLADPNFTPSVLADEAGLSRRTMYAAFAEMQTSFGRELAKMRLEKARTLLDVVGFDKKTIAEIGLMVGYVNTSLFITRFRQRFGITPEAYRKTRQA